MAKGDDEPIGEDLGRYLDSLVKPVEPEWVMGWVARRRRMRAAVVTGCAFALAATTGVLGYALHSSPVAPARFGAGGASTTSTAVITTTSPSASTSTTTATTVAPGGSHPTVPPTVPPVTTVAPPVTGPPPGGTANPALPDFPYAQPGDVTAATAFSTPSLTVGAPVKITVTVVNTRDYGVALIANGFGYGVYFEMAPAAPVLVHLGFERFAAPLNGAFLELAPHTTLRASVRWVPTVGGSGTARLVLERLYEARPVNVSQTPTPVTIAPAVSTAP